jgi:hypothetical protein
VAGGEIVQADHPGAFGEERFAEVGTDEAGAAGDEDALVFEEFGRFLGHFWVPKSEVRSQKKIKSEIRISKSEKLKSEIRISKSEKLKSEIRISKSEKLKSEIRISKSETNSNYLNSNDRNYNMKS